MEQSSIAPIDVPQADDIAKIRAVIEVVAEGESRTASVAKRLAISERHAAYRLHAARILQALSLEEGRWRIEAAGQELLNRPHDDPTERDWWRRAIGTNRIISTLAPQLLGTKAPSTEDIADRIVKYSGLAPATAERRAQTLVRWRRDLCQVQRELFA